MSQGSAVKCYCTRVRGYIDRMRRLTHHGLVFCVVQYFRANDHINRTRPHPGEGERVGDKKCVRTRYIRARTTVVNRLDIAYSRDWYYYYRSIIITGVYC